jgi:5-methylcytosine-specific restriction protein B
LKVIFEGQEYKKNGRNGIALKNLCFDIFKHYLDLNRDLQYYDLQNIFNQWHCNNNFVILSKADWESKTEDLKRRYFEPVEYNNQEIYFTTQWGNNGGNCDNVNNMIKFATKEGYDIHVVDDEVQKSVSINIKNIILYGAPGVGKTHNYKKLLALIEGGDFSEKDIFDFVINNKDDEIEEGSIERLYQQVKDEKRVEFVTFHQSYSYEDFIEGFRPNESGNIELEDGIFKNISDKAKLNLEDSQKNKKEVEIKYSFSKLLDEFKIFVEDKISTDGTFFLKGKATISNIGKSSFLVGGSVSSGQKLTFNILERDYDNFKNGIIKSYKDIKSTFESEKGVHGNAPYYFALYEKLKEFEDTVYEHSNQEKLEVIEQKNFYIVIDEINRGNISKIFGELITLIEEDKRDVYEVTLPYSKELFKVPSNLYIIATMNSTDKSIATIDIALRRRFTFLKMKPNESLILHVRAKELFNALNSFIKEKLSEDYMLGHSYFMNINDDEDLEFVKEYKIRPLLEEYFYADDENFKKAEEMLTNSKGKTNE